MKINWFKINYKYLQDDLLFHYSLMGDALIFVELIIYLKQGSVCTDCSNSSWKCNCNYCEKCKNLKCVCNLTMNKISNITYNLIINSLSKQKIKLLINDMKKHFNREQLVSELFLKKIKLLEKIL